MKSAGDPTWFASFAELRGDQAVISAETDPALAAPELGETRAVPLAGFVLDSPSSERERLDMQTLRLKVTIPENHELVVKLPEDVPSGPAELVVQVEAPAEESVSRPSVREASRRFAEVARKLAEDPRPFKELSLEERRARLQQIAGIGRGLSSGTEEFMRRKQEEIDLEEGKFGRR